MTEPTDAAAGPPAENRRNHYRVLHVQPEAPLEVIKASYRTLMGRLRVHPDLGGNTAQAAMVNDAWAVLSDPARRSAYDRQLRELVLAHRHGEALQAERHCPLCGHPVPLLLRPDSRCGQCSAPLAALPEPGTHGHELLGRRAAPRRDQAHVAMLHVGWPSPALPVRWRDLSLTGLSFYAPEPLQPAQRVHLIDQALEAVAEVVSSRAQGRVFAVHARLLSALLLQTTGVFVSTQA
jgi:curved DNA-binding protein CbpA